MDDEKLHILESTEILKLDLWFVSGYEDLSAGVDGKQW